MTCTTAAAILPFSALAVVRPKVRLAVQIHGEDFAIGGGVEGRREGTAWFRSRRLG